MQETNANEWFQWARCQDVEKKKKKWAANGGSCSRKLCCASEPSRHRVFHAGLQSNFVCDTWNDCHLFVIASGTFVVVLCNQRVLQKWKRKNHFLLSDFEQIIRFQRFQLSNSGNFVHHCCFAKMLSKRSQWIGICHHNWHCDMATTLLELWVALGTSKQVARQGVERKSCSGTVLTTIVRGQLPWLIGQWFVACAQHGVHWLRQPGVRNQFTLTISWWSASIGLLCWWLRHSSKILELGTSGQVSEVSWC